MYEFLEFLENIDHQLLLEVNKHVGGFGDSVMIMVSGKWFWIPLYALFLILIQRKVGSDNLIYLLIAVFALIVMTDQGSVYFFKDVFERYRPCHHEYLKDILILPTGNCGGTYGFISSHSANMFGLATLVYSIMKAQSKLWLLVFLWAGMVSFSRVYLAVHYPSDILVGMIYGTCCGLAISILFRKTRKYS